MVAWYIVSTLSEIPYIFISKVIPINILKSLFLVHFKWNKTIKKRNIRQILLWTKLYKVGLHRQSGIPTSNLKLLHIRKNPSQFFLAGRWVLWPAGQFGSWYLHFGPFWFIMSPLRSIIIPFRFILVHFGSFRWLY
jgi:hypothetical protein